MDRDVSPKGPWHPLALLTVAAFCAPASIASAQQDRAAAAGTEPPTVEHAAHEDAGTSDPAPPAEPSTSAPQSSAADVPIETEALAQPVPPADSEAAAETAAPPADAVEATVASVEPPAGIGNADVHAMVEAQFSDSTIISIIGANDVQFDLSPRALVALKGGGVSETVIEAMIAAEEEKERATQPEPTRAELAETQASLEYARLTEMIEELAAKQEEAEQARRAPEPPASRADPAPRVWIVSQADRAAIAPTIAQVAFAGGSSRRGERMKNLQGIAGQALAFANPAVSGIATTLGSLFRPDEERTAVWALAGTASARVLDVDPVFEIDFAHIPGVDPDRYQPAIVALVATKDNYRLVAAAETDGDTGALPRGPIIEEDVATDSTRLGRGQYRVAARSPLPPGEYALVLRPIPESGRARRRNSEASLGELLGGSTSQILYLTWEFSKVAR